MDDALLALIDTRLAALETRILAHLQAATPPPESEWVDSKTFCKLVGLPNTKALTYQMSKGVIQGKAIRNIGTVQRPCYRFHRKFAVDQFLNRSAAKSPAS